MYNFDTKLIFYAEFENIFWLMALKIVKYYQTPMLK